MPWANRGYEIRPSDDQKATRNGNCRVFMLKPRSDTADEKCREKDVWNQKPLMGPWVPPDDEWKEADISGQEKNRVRTRSSDTESHQCAEREQGTIDSNSAQLDTFK